jgi:hypothetical protein
MLAEACTGLALKDPSAIDGCGNWAGKALSLKISGITGADNIAAPRLSSNGISDGKGACTRLNASSSSIKDCVIKAAEEAISLEGSTAADADTVRDTIPPAGAAVGTAIKIIPPPPTGIIIVPIPIPTLIVENGLMSSWFRTWGGRLGLSETGGEGGVGLSAVITPVLLDTYV